MNKDCIEQGILFIGVLAVIWLLSAFEVGAAGTWAVWCIVGIALGLCGLIAYDVWAETEDYKRCLRNTAKMTRRVIEQTKKEMYLREITY